MTANGAISHDFRTGRIEGATLVERIGLELMRIAAFILAPFAFFGFSYAARLVRGIFRSSRAIWVRFADDCVFEYPYGDAYWGRLLYNRETYGPEVEPFLRFVRDTRYAFIDCGSNFGYMSVLTTSRDFGSQPTIAIEADAENYKLTVRNARINGERYEHRHNAVFAQGGSKVGLYGTKHEARSIVETAGDRPYDEVTTIAIDDLLDWVAAHGKNIPVVIKLDIEGVEIEALKGAKRMLDRDCLIIYEEHGSDKTHEVSRHIKEQMGYRLFFDDRPRLSELTSWKQLDALKVHRRQGYDLFATVSQFWIDRISRFNQHVEAA